MRCGRGWGRRLRQRLDTSATAQFYSYTRCTAQQQQQQLLCVCVCVCLCKSATMAGCCGWYKYNYNNNNNRLVFFLRAPALSVVCSCALFVVLRVCVSDTIWSLFSNIFKVYCAKIYNQTRRDNTAAAAQQQQQQQNTSTTTTTTHNLTSTTHWLLWNILTTFTVRRCLFLPRSRARDWGLSCRCVDQKVMRPFHFAPARAENSLSQASCSLLHTHTYIVVSIVTRLTKPAEKLMSEKVFFLVQPWFLVKLVIVVRFTEWLIRLNRYTKCAVSTRRKFNYFKC